MKIPLYPRHPPVDPVNVTVALSIEFANLIRELTVKREFEKIEGLFTIYKDGKGPVMIELVFDEK